MKVLLVIAVPLVMFSFVVNQFGMHFFDGEFPFYEENSLYALDQGSSVRVLITGDSRAKYDWFPPVLSSNTYNYALGGLGCVQTYYYLQQYFENHEAPAYLIYTMAPGHFLGSEAFWTRSMYFHRFTPTMLLNLLMVLTDKDSCDEFFRAVTKQPQSSLSVSAEAFLYFTYSPLKYRDAFLKGLDSRDRYIRNEELFSQIIECGGRWPVGDSEGCDGLSGVEKYTSFSPNPVYDYYFRKTIELCETRGTKFIFQVAPDNSSTFNLLKPQFIAEWNEYMGSIRQAYPNAIINSEFFPMDNRYFWDTNHLNLRGAETFSTLMKSRYKGLFD